jgi:hypothetical protein
MTALPLPAAMAPVLQAGNPSGVADMPQPKPSLSRLAYGDPGPADAGLSLAVVVLLVVGALVVAVAFIRMSDALLDMGLLGTGVFLAIGARICQARNQHQALHRLIERSLQRR